MVGVERYICTLCGKSVHRALVSRHYRYEHSGGIRSAQEPQLEDEWLRDREELENEDWDSMREREISVHREQDVESEDADSDSIEDTDARAGQEEGRGVRARIRLEELPGPPLLEMTTVLELVRQEFARRRPPVEATECALCLERHTCKILPCNHTNACATCLARWWRESFYCPRCPICRGEANIVMDGHMATSVVAEWYLWRADQVAD